MNSKAISNSPPQRSQVLDVRDRGRAYRFNLMHLVEKDIPANHKTPTEIKKEIHRHDVFHILLFLKGKGVLSHQNQDLEVKKGHVLVINPGEPHSIKFRNDQPLRFLNITFQLFTPKEKRYNDALNQYLSCLTGKEFGVLPQPYNPHPDLFNILVKQGQFCLDWVRNKTTIGPPRPIQYHLVKFFFDLSECFPGGQDQAQEPQFPSWLKNQLRYIQHNLNTPLNIDELAKQAGFSRGHYQRSFKALVHCTPLEHVVQLRIKRSKSMLLSTDWPIKWIAEKNGFKNEQYFSKVFKKFTGTPPATYRRKMDLL